MKAPSKQEQRFLLGVVAAGVVVVFFYVNYLLRPMMKTLSKLSADIRSAQVQVQTIEQSLTQEPALDREYQQLTQKLQHLKTSLPSEQGMPNVIELLSNLASQTGLKIRTIFPQRTVENLGLMATGKTTSPASSSELYKEIPIQIEAQTGFHQLGAFLSRMESGVQPMELKTLRVTADPKDGRRHTAKVIIAAFFSTIQPGSGSSANDRGAGL